MAVAQFNFGSLEGAFPALYVGGAVTEAETISGANAATTVAATNAQNVCRVVCDTASYVSFGSAPNAGTDSVRFYMPANVVEYFRVKSGDKAAVIAA